MSSVVSGLFHVFFFGMIALKRKIKIGEKGKLLNKIIKKNNSPDESFYTNISFVKKDRQ